MVRAEMQNEFEQLYARYCCEPQFFNMFTTYLKNSRLFPRLRPLTKQDFLVQMHEFNNILIESAQIRQEYTFFVCSANQERMEYFNRNTFMSSSTAYQRETFRSNTIKDLRHQHFFNDEESVAPSNYGRPRQKRNLDAQSEMSDENGFAVKHRRQTSKKTGAFAHVRGTVDQMESEVESLLGGSKKAKKTKAKKQAALRDRDNRNMDVDERESMLESELQKEQIDFRGTEEQSETYKTPQPPTTAGGPKKQKKPAKKAAEPKKKAKRRASSDSNSDEEPDDEDDLNEMSFDASETKPTK